MFVELFREHRSRAAVADALQVNQRTLHRWLKRLEEAGYPDPRETATPEGQPVVGRRPSGFTAPEIRGIKMRYAEGETMPEIARSLGVPVSRITHALRSSKK